MSDHDEVTLGRGELLAHLRSRTTTVADIGGCSHEGRRRDRNEDAWGYETGRIFVVADGMGGRSAGDLAAQVTVETLLSELDEQVMDWHAAIQRVNDAVCQAGIDAGVDSLGAVAVALRCVGDRVSIVHVGDARAYRLRGELTQQLTRDHSIAEAIADLGLRRSDTGLADRQLSALTSYFGSPGSVDEFTVHEISAHHGDRIVLCSDGVHGSLTLTHWQAARSAPTAGVAAELLIGEAIAAGASDDCTALVVDFDVALANDLPTDAP